MNDRQSKPRPEVETLQRVRRIETRLTQTMIAMGIHTDSQKPEFDAGNLQGNASVVVPSRHTSLAEILGAIPQAFSGPVLVTFQGETLATLDRDART